MLVNLNKTHLKNSDKATKRKEVLHRRNESSERYRRVASFIIERKVLARYYNLSSFLIYKSYKSEVSTDYLTSCLMLCHKTIYFPVMTGDNLAFGVGNYGYKDKKYGIYEPVKIVPTPKKLDVCIVPIVGFDKNRNRLGYGKGFYDRLLRHTHIKHIIGIAFENQIVSSITTNNFDIKMHTIITEKRTYGG